MRFLVYGIEKIHLQYIEKKLDPYGNIYTDIFVIKATYIQCLLCKIGTF